MRACSLWAFLRAQTDLRHSGYSATWLLSNDHEWYELTSRGPRRYPRYARLRYIPDPTHEGQRESDAEIPDEFAAGPSELWQMAVAVSLLAQHTDTPGDCLPPPLGGLAQPGLPARRCRSSRPVWKTGIGASNAAITDLLADLRIDTIGVLPDGDPPRYLLRVTRNCRHRDPPRTVGTAASGSTPRPLMTR